MTSSEKPLIVAQQSDRPLSSPPLQAPVDLPRGADPAQPYLQIEGVNKQFGQYIALRDVYLNVYPGEFVCLLGPSGCGKTTLLRIIAGLEEQTSGRVIQAGKDVSHLPPSKRDFGIVFQSYALFPNLTAEQNIAYGLQNAKKDRQAIAQRVEELLDLVGLAGLGKKYPSQMSGGQQQRVALARALALSPGLLLLDEPLSALDAQVRVKLRTEIAQLQKQLGITTVMVTHDQAEALAMADRIVVMEKGGFLAQVGAPQTIYQRPSSPFVANFIGVMNFLNGVATGTDQVRCGNVVLTTPQHDLSTDQAVMIAVRPEDIRVLDQHVTEDQANVMMAEIVGSEFLGSAYRLTLSPDGNSRDLLTLDVSVHQSRELDLGLRATLKIQLPPALIHLFPAPRG